jgi:hypothetical protein
MKSHRIAIATALLLGVSSFAVLRAAEVDQRQEKQQDRIEQGEKSGELTNKEAKHLEKEHKAIGKEIKADRAANGGKLTKEEKKDINQQQNKESKQIYRKKHNGRKKK